MKEIQMDLWLMEYAMVSSEDDVMVQKLEVSETEMRRELL